MSKGGQKSTSSNPKWLDDAGKEVYDLAKGAVFQPTGSSNPNYIGTATGQNNNNPSAPKTYSPGSVPEGTLSNKWGWFDSGSKSWVPYGSSSTIGSQGQQNGTIGGISGLKPLEQYDGERYAPIGSSGQQMIDMAGNAVSRMQDYNKNFDTAFGWLGDATTPWGQTYNANTIDTGKFTQADADTYMNPYRNNVLDVAASDLDRAAQIQALQAHSGQVSRKSFGGSRQAITDAERERSLTDSKRKLYAEGLDSSFQTGLQAYLQEAARKLQADTANEDARYRGYESNRNQKNTEANNYLSAAASSGNLATQKSSIASQEMSRLAQAAQLQQAAADRNKDWDYSQFVEKRDYPKSQIEWLANIINGSASKNSQQQTPQSNTAGSIIGAGATLGGAAIQAGLFSDERLKDDIKIVGWKNGLKIVEFSYKGTPQKYRGVIAQDVKKKYPHAVHEQDGFLKVDYEAIDIHYQQNSLS